MGQLQHWINPKILALSLTLMFWPSVYFDQVWLFFLVDVYVWNSCSFSFGKDSARWYSSLPSCLSACISEKGGKKAGVFHLTPSSHAWMFQTESLPTRSDQHTQIHVESISSVRYGETDMRLWNKAHDMNMNIAVGSLVVKVFGFGIPARIIVSNLFWVICRSIKRVF